MTQLKKKLRSEGFCHQYSRVGSVIRRWCVCYSSTVYLTSLSAHTHTHTHTQLKVSSPCHYGLEEENVYSSICCLPQYQMEIWPTSRSGHFSPCKKPKYPLNTNRVDPRAATVCFDKQKSLVPFGTQTLVRPSRSSYVCSVSHSLPNPAFL